MVSAHTSVADEPKSKMVVTAEDAAALSARVKICVDNVGSHVLAGLSCKDSCEQFLKFLTSAKRKELKQIELNEADDAACYFFVKGQGGNESKYL